MISSRPVYAGDPVNRQSACLRANRLSTRAKAVENGVFRLRGRLADRSGRIDTVQNGFKMSLYRFVAKTGPSVEHFVVPHNNGAATRF